MSASTPPRREILVRAFLLAVCALVLSGGASLLRARLGDGFAGAWWIGRFEVARLGKPATLVFGTRFTLAAPATRPGNELPPNPVFFLIPSSPTPVGPVTTFRFEDRRKR